MKELSYDLVRALFDYDPETGVLSRRVSAPGAKAGTVSGRLHATGYLRVGVQYKTYAVHRIAWLWFYGEIAPQQIDHLNRVKTDNRIANLRLATPAVNSQNRDRTLGSTGYVGVKRIKGRAKWAATLGINRVRKHLGNFDSPEEAAQAYIAARRTLHAYVEGCK